MFDLRYRRQARPLLPTSSLSHTLRPLVPNRNRYHGALIRKMLPEMGLGKDEELVQFDFHVKSLAKLRIAAEL